MICNKIINANMYKKVTSPLGRKSIPTIYSKSELFPLLCEPTTTILGIEMYFYNPRSLRRSIKVITFRRLSNK